ncbi:MAG: putative bifunctional diguanylate cyclase/phosphodiesterase [bacterium]|nr:EAL domain-containing protein [Betaproteobacteria bacterium]
MPEELARLRTIAAMVESSDDAIISKTLDGKVLSWNSGAERLYGIPGARAIGRQIDRLFADAGGSSSMSDRLRRVAEGETVRDIEIERRLRDGRTLYVRETLSPILDAYGRIVAAAVITRDITAHAAVELALARERWFMRQVIDTVPSLVYVRDANGRFLIANRAVAETMARTVDEVEGALLADLLPCPEDHERYRRVDEEVLASGRTMVFDDEFRTHGGDSRWFQTVKTPLSGDNGQPLLLGVSTDITARKKLEQHNHALANFDQVTGLPTRALLEDRVAGAIAMARRNSRCVGVVFCDLDRFKRINDTLGHATGDALLRAVGERARTLLRESDTVARLGGDEFVILLSDVTGTSDARQVCTKLLKGMKMPYEVMGHSITVTPSLGLALYPFDGADAVSLIRSADAAMYQAKSSGRANLQCFSNEIDARTKSSHALGCAIEKAVDRDELRLHYQPQISSRAGHVRVVEALLRWQHPEQGLLLPAAFLPLAEDIGVIDAMGDWVLEQACSQAAEWSRRGISNARISVNLSTLQCTRADLVERISQALGNSRLDPSRLEIEVTETLLLRGAGPASAFVHDLKALGVTVAIDDFGTGYSSLSNLTRLPIDRLKIDGTFVQGLGNRDDDEAVVTGIVQMAHALQLTTVAEGVETVQQVRFLRDCGCDDLQGYLICPPLNGDAMNDWLSSRQSTASGIAA